MKRIISVLHGSKKGWRETTGLAFRKMLPAVLAVTALVFLVQLAGVGYSLHRAAELNWQTDSYDYTTGNMTLVQWGPRLETLMSYGWWYPLSAAGYVLVLLTGALTPVRMAGGNRITLSRLPVGGCAPHLGSALSCFGLSLFYWAAELANLFAAEALYSRFVPEAARLPDPAMLALMRWDVLNGLFPAARPGLGLLMLVTVFLQAVTVSCIGWNLAEGRERAGGQIIGLVILLAMSAVQYQIGMGVYGFSLVPLAGAVSTGGSVLHRQFSDEGKEQS